MKGPMGLAGSRFLPLLLAAASLAVLGPGCDPGHYQCWTFEPVSFGAMGPRLEGETWKAQESAVRAGHVMTVRGIVTTLDVSCGPACGFVRLDVIQEGDARADLCAGLTVIERAQDFQPGTPGFKQGATICLIGVFVVDPKIGHCEV